jgi:hypothetical protein
MNAKLEQISAQTAKGDTLGHMSGACVSVGSILVSTVRVTTLVSPLR